MRSLGVSHVPEDRQNTGLVMTFRAYESAILGYHHEARYGRGPMLDWRAVASDAQDRMKAFDVRPARARQLTAEFSGGNQQKLVLAREIDRASKVLLVGQPTRGVDIGAVEFIHDRIRGLRAAGRAILVVSANLDEVIGLSDRVLVMANARIAGEVRAGRAAERDLGLLMGGVRETDGPGPVP
jgi:simple sugar transport system ATP-binding protein